MTALVTGISHIATVTEDLDRMVGFYRRIFDAEAGPVIDEGHHRHQFVFLGEQVALHPFEVDGLDLAEPADMFHRGRIDHFGITVPSVEALHEVRDRLVAEGVTDAEIADFGELYSLRCFDPDGVEVEINLFKSDGTL